jgi:HTH-type transcriptional regulator / antitoxin HipB
VETIARTPLQLGNSIRERRRKLGLSQEQLAAKLSVRQKTVSDIESAGTGRLDTLLRALVALDLELVIRPRTKGSASDIESIF